MHRVLINYKNLHYIYPPSSSSILLAMMLFYFILFFEKPYKYEDN
jgi:hypothetical protein